MKRLNKLIIVWLNNLEVKVLKNIILFYDIFM